MKTLKKTAARRGILIKQPFQPIYFVILSKETLFAGNLVVCNELVVPSDLVPDFWGLVASIEQDCGHAIAKVLREYAFSKSARRFKVESVKQVAGRGITGAILLPSDHSKQLSVYIGSRDWLVEQGCQGGWIDVVASGWQKVFCLRLTKGRKNRSLRRRKTSRSEEKL